MSYFAKVLIANRGEIAVRLIRACQELGIVAVAVYSEADRAALHVRLADEAYPIGPSPAAESYLRSDTIVEVALRCGAEAIHPGYGFLSERAHFAHACAAAGIVFIGPPADVINRMGSKIAAKRLALANSVPVVPGYDGDDQAVETLEAEAGRIGYPLLIKASAGGGGKGMRAVTASGEFRAALEGARREALAGFGDEAVLLERLLARPRHVEFQIFADAHGHVLHLGERECSIQRRHQKIVEESPCVALDERLRSEMGAAAVRLARAAGYRNAGTVEFMLDQNGRFYFLEMNTRLQVEHPVTELITGLDLVHLQFAVAAGEALPMTQEQVRLRGHAIEARVYAEDPGSYLPQIGPVHAVVAPDGPGIRNDVGLAGGDEVSVHYDPMIAKLSVHAPDRASAIGRLRRALGDYAVLGLITNLPLLQRIVDDPRFVAGETHTGFLDEVNFAPEVTVATMPPEVLVAAALAGASPTAVADPFARLWRSTGTERRFRFTSAGTTYSVTLSGNDGQFVAALDDQSFIVREVACRGTLLVLAFDQRQERFWIANAGGVLAIQWRGLPYTLRAAGGLSVEDVQPGATAPPGHVSLEAPMSSTVVKLLVEEGQAVESGAPLVVLEAMKMEHTIAAPHAGTITKVHVRAGQLAAGGLTLIEIEAEAAGEHRSFNH